MKIFWTILTLLRDFDFCLAKMFTSRLISITGSYTEVLFSYNRNAAFFTNVSLVESVSAMRFKDRPRFHSIVTLHLSEIANYFVIITKRLYLIQRRSNTSPWNWHETNTTIAMDTFDWRPPKLSFWIGKKNRCRARVTGNRWNKIWQNQHYRISKSTLKNRFFT